MERERVIFSEQPVALVLAESATAAEDAIEHVNVSYEPLPAVFTLADAMADDAPLVWPNGAAGESEKAAAHSADVGGEEEDDLAQRSNVANRSHFRRGDVVAGFTEGRMSFWNDTLRRRWRIRHRWRRMVAPFKSIPSPRDDRVDADLGPVCSAPTGG